MGQCIPSSETLGILWKKSSVFGKKSNFFGKISHVFADRSEVGTLVGSFWENAGRKEESHGALGEKMGDFEGEVSPFFNLSISPKWRWCAIYVKICPKEGRKLLFYRRLWSNRWRLWKQKEQNSCKARARARARERDLRVVMNWIWPLRQFFWFLFGEMVGKAYFCSEFIKVGEVQRRFAVLVSCFSYFFVTYCSKSWLCFNSNWL